MKRKIIAALLAMTLLLSGCAGKPGRTPADGTEPDGGPLNTERMIV